MAVIHTSPTLTPLFGARCAGAMPEMEVFHMVDESLIRDTIRTGHLQRRTTRRLLGMIESAEGSGADAVMVTCSSPGAGVKPGQQLFDVPVIRVDEAMAEEAVRQAKILGVVATLRTTLEPAVALLEEKGREAGKRIELRTSLCDGAFEAERPSMPQPLRWPWRIDRECARRTWKPVSPTELRLTMQHWPPAPASRSRSPVRLAA